MWSNTEHNDLNNIRQILSKLGSNIFENRKIIEDHQDLIHNSNVPVFITNDIGKFVYTNLSYQEMLEVNLDEVLDFGWQNFVETSFINTLKIRWYNLVFLGQPYHNLPVIYKSKTGKIFTKFVSVDKINNNGFLGYIENV